MPNKHVKLGFRFNLLHANVSFYLIPIILTLSGFLIYRENAYPFYETLFILSTGLCTTVLLLCGIWEFLSYYLASPVPGHRLQWKKKDPPMYFSEAVETVMCIYIVACFMAWPVTRIRLDEPTAFKETLKECVPKIFENCVTVAYLGKVFLTLLIADTHTFWKHYFLHNPTFYIFHKSHHKFHNPSTFACFAIHPVEAVWTFWPILLICLPELFFKGFMGLYLPIHVPFLAFFSLLNLYLHCGYSIPLLEWVLPKLWINTSKWHNKHHELSITHFGEMLTIWDYAMGTHTGNWSTSKYEAQIKKVVQGKSGMDDKGVVQTLMVRSIILKLL